MESKASLKREIEKLNALHDINTSLRTLDLHACLNAIASRLRDLFSATFADILLLEGDHMSILASEGYALPQRGVTISSSEGLVGWVAQNAKSLLVNDVRSDPRYYKLYEDIRSEMAAPLMVAGECIGVLDVESTTLNAYNGDDLHLLEIVASTTASAVRNAQMHSETETWRAYYQGVLDQTGDVIYSVDKNLRLTSVNAAWDDFARANRGEAWLANRVVGKELLEAFQKPEREKWQKVCADLLAGRSKQYEEEIPCHAPGQERWLTIRAAALRGADGKPDGIIFSTHDISAYIQSQRQLRAANARLTALVDTAALLTQELDETTLLDLAVEKIEQLYATKCVAITRLDETDASFRVAAARGASQKFMAEYRTSLPSADEIMGQFGKAGTIYSLQQLPISHNRELYEQEGLHSLLFATLRSKETVNGSLLVFSGNPEQRFSENDQRLLETMAAQLSLALNNARLYAEQRLLADTDGLTGLVNRRRFNQILQMELQRSARYKRPLALAMLDVDHFKSLNDTFGHLVGDAALLEISRTIRKQMREVDILGRYGGDELILMLPETDEAGARTALQRMVDSVHDLIIAGIDLTRCEKRPSLSAGISLFPQHARDATALQARADLALYQAKRNGRDRLEVFIEKG